MAADGNRYRKIEVEYELEGEVNNLKLFLDAMKSGAPVIIFGCTKIGEKICEEIKFIDKEVNLCFFDNDLKKQGSYYCGFPVLKLEELEEKRLSAYFIIASSNAYEEIMEQLIGLGVKEDFIILPEPVLKRKIEFLKKDISRYKDIIEKRTPKKKLGFVVDLAEHCNLNCKSCDHFSPLARPFFTDKNYFTRDMKRMREIFGDHVTHIDLEGGEPLLNPEIVEFINIVSDIFPYTQIRIFTNGILLPKMSEEFWTECRTHHVILELTKYPINFNYDVAEDLASQHHVQLQYYSGGDVIKTSMHKPLDLEGMQDKYDNYHRCWNANSECIMLKKGKIYTCTMIPNLEIFNNYFHQNLEVTEKDYIDIYKNVTAEEIFEFLCNPMPACRYCKVREWTSGHKWEITERNIKEWI